MLAEKLIAEYLGEAKKVSMKVLKDNAFDAAIKKANLTDRDLKKVSIKKSTTAPEFDTDVIFTVVLTDKGNRKKTYDVVLDLETGSYKGAGLK